MCGLSQVSDSGTCRALRGPLQSDTQPALAPATGAHCLSPRCSCLLLLPLPVVVSDKQRSIPDGYVDSLHADLWLFKTHDEGIPVILYVFNLLCFYTF